MPKPKKDILNITTLILLALTIGVFLILTTIVISKDGTHWIEQSKLMGTNGINTVKTFPGYPFLILMGYKTITFFQNDPNIYTWIHAAQSVSLLCRLMSIVFLYLIGKRIVGQQQSFLALLILICLPYPAQFGSSILREWPHIMFLSAGILCLVLSKQNLNPLLFATAGIIVALGQTVRPECVQILLYALAWIVFYCLRHRNKQALMKSTIAALAIILGFSIIALPSFIIRKTELIPCFEFSQIWDLCPETQTQVHHKLTAALLPFSTLDALKLLMERLSDNLAYFFIIPMTIGIYSFAKKTKDVFTSEHFFTLGTITLYIAMMLALYTTRGYISRRHCMPIVVFGAFYIPAGLKIISLWLSKKFNSNSTINHKNRKIWFYALLALGFIFCLAKFTRIVPIGAKKKYILKTAQWLNKNTKPTDIITASDNRIAFYAERKWTKEQTNIASYVVKVYKNRSNISEIAGSKKVFSKTLENKKIIEIYDVSKLYDPSKYISQKLELTQWNCQRVSTDKFKFILNFKIKEKLENDFMLYFHAYVENENVSKLSEKRQKYKFDNWGFNPLPPTSTWEKGNIEISQTITTKPLKYNLKFGLWNQKLGDHGSRLHLGWLDMNNIQIKEQ